MVDRISSSVHTSQLIDNNLRLQKKYAEKQVQTATGVQTDTYTGMSKDASKVMSLEADYNRIITQSENAQTALDRNEVAFDTFAQITDITQSFEADLNAAISGLSIGSNEIQEIANSTLDQLESLLNTQVAGRYIFGGSATQTAPADFNDPAFGGATIPSAADTDYYQGNDYIQSVEASDGLSVNYGVTANDAAIEEIVRALDLVRTTPNDPSTLQEALSLIQSGLDGVAITKAKISQDSQKLDQSINANLEDVNLIDSMISDVKDVDLAEVSVKLQELEAQLEASYSVTTDLLNLKLSDYI
jgi:flagellar hook-associated protein 3 FlgL